MNRVIQEELDYLLNIVYDSNVSISVYNDFEYRIEKLVKEVYSAGYDDGNKNYHNENDL